MPPSWPETGPPTDWIGECAARVRVLPPHMGGRSTYLAIEVGGAGRHPGAGRGPDADPAALLDPNHHLALARSAAATGADLLLLADRFAPARADLPAPDAVAVAARVAPLVPGLGLVPTATVTHTEPFHLAKAIGTLDLVSRGWAGWQPAVSRTPAEAALVGRKPAAPAAELWGEAAEAVQVVVRLWDSWEDDAVIRDVATGRYVDRAKLHYIDFAGEFFAVKGPSITPRSPQGHPLVVLPGDEDAALPVAAAWADVVRIDPPEPAAAAPARERVRAAVAAAGRDPDAVAVLLDLPVLLADDADAARRRLDRLDELAAAGGTDPAAIRPAVVSADELVELVTAVLRERAADGITLVPLELAGTLPRLVEQVAPRLRAAGLLAPSAPGRTLRGRFGLPRPANHFAGVSR